MSKAQSVRQRVGTLFCKRQKVLGCFTPGLDTVGSASRRLPLAALKAGGWGGVGGGVFQNRTQLGSCFESWKSETAARA